ncbi:MAG TPA: methyltransferase [Geobacteraceae bacterium]|nr:methyltransferase [Geobacteraceae bacterium]
MSSTEPKKHPCPDCNFCQWCGDDRCELCLRKENCCRKTLSLAEQIAQYDEMNRKGRERLSIDETEDQLRDYDLKIIQPKDGYRFSLDPLLLCDFAGSRALRILDLGSGCGIIPLVMARKAPDSRIVGVEFQTEMALLAQRNVSGNDLSGRVTVIESDILSLKGSLESESFDLVISNPPYRKQGEGKTSPKAGRDRARHESTASLADFLAIAKRMVKPGGSVCMIYNPERLPELLAACLDINLCPVRLQMVHGDFSLPARMFLIELLKGKKRALEVLPPIAVKESIYAESQQAGMRRGR